jgi:hypothetical protein
MVFQRESTASEQINPREETQTDILSITKADIKTSRIAMRLQDKPEPTTFESWYKQAPIGLQHLTGKIELLFDENENQSWQTTYGNTFQIASDGGHDPKTGISTFGWIISANKTLIAKGRGITQVHKLLAESFRSESYGLASAGLFISNLTKHFDIDKQKQTWKIYIDSKSLIKRMETYQEQINISRWNLRADEDITKLTRQLWEDIPHTLVHVKSHQDDNTDFEKLSYPALLNVLADEQATRQQNVMEAPVETVANIARVQLRLQDIAITRDSQRWLLRSAGRIPITQYYKEKYGWTTQTFNSIAWEIQAKALRTFSESDQTRLLKFVHGWLPTQKRLHMEGSAKTPRCLLCPTLVEDNNHMLCCQHPTMIDIQEKIPIYIQKMLHDHGNSEMLNLLEIGLSESLTQTWTAKTSHVSTVWQQSIQDQNSIGWRQLYNGRISLSLIETMDNHYRELGLNVMQFTGTRWAIRLIVNLWSTILELWKARNEIIHDKESTKTTNIRKEQIKGHVLRCYELSNMLSLKDRNQWFSMGIAEMLTQDVKFMEAWVKITERVIRIAKREQKKKSKSRIFMEKFLQINSSRPKCRNRQPMTRPRAFSQEMNPD